MKKILLSLIIVLMLTSCTTLSRIENYSILNKDTAPSMASLRDSHAPRP